MRQGLASALYKNTTLKKLALVGNSVGWQASTLRLGCLAWWFLSNYSNPSKKHPGPRGSRGIFFLGEVAGEDIYWRIDEDWKEYMSWFFLCWAKRTLSSDVGSHVGCWTASSVDSNRKTRAEWKSWESLIGSTSFGNLSWETGMVQVSIEEDQTFKACIWIVFLHVPEVVERAHGLSHVATYLRGASTW